MIIPRLLGTNLDRVEGPHLLHRCMRVHHPLRFLEANILRLHGMWRHPSMRWHPLRRKVNGLLVDLLEPVRLHHEAGLLIVLSVTLC